MSIAEGYAFLKGYQELGKPLPKGWKEKLAPLLDVNRMITPEERGLLQKMQQEITLIKGTGMDEKIQQLLKTRFEVAASGSLTSFLYDKIDAIMGQIFRALNLLIFAEAESNIDRERSGVSEVRKAELRKRQESSKQTRAAMEVLGGEPLTLVTEDKVKIDGMYLSAAEFRKKLKEAGVKRFDDGRLQGLLVEDRDHPLMAALMRMGAFEVGWAKIAQPVGRPILIVDSFMAPHMPYVFNQKNLIIKDIEESPSAGTVIIPPGGAMPYEAYKKEAFSFLLRGVDVMLINYRGYGQSEGFPTAQGVYKDIEAAYQFVQQNKQRADQQIVAMGYCLGGNIVSEMARCHPVTQQFFCKI